MTSGTEEFAAAGVVSPLVGQIAALVRWVGDGRKLTATGALTLADARAAVAVVGTGDVIDPVIGDRVFRTRSSAELLDLGLLVSWVRAAGLVRVVKGRLVPVKRGSRLLGRPEELWPALFDAFVRAGPAYLPGGFGESLVRREFPAVHEAMLGALDGGEGAVAVGDLCEMAWRTAAAPYMFEGATPSQLGFARSLNDRDVERVLEVLARLGALTVTDTPAGATAQLTAAARRRVRALRGEPAPGEPVYRLRVTLLEVDKPTVWRTVLVPAAAKLSQLHETVQAAMGWQDAHLHSFTDGERVYGPPDDEFPITDSNRMRLCDLDLRRGLLYTYDFGDGWEHAITLEALESAEPGRRYPCCTGGTGACPPEDCGGAPGYEHLKAVLSNGDDPEHHDMLAWIGVDAAEDFDPAAFDADAAQDRLHRLGVLRR